jgi:hypothetical protein
MTILQKSLKIIRNSILTLFLLIPSLALLGEGTKSIWPIFSGLGTGNESGGLLVNYISDPVNGSYPAYTFNSTSDERMYVRISDFTMESIKFAFNVRRVWFTDCSSVPDANGNYTNAVTGGRRVHWRLKDPNGVVVATSGATGIPYWNGGVTPSTVPGFIGTHAEAVNGPDGFNGVVTTGYTPLSHTPTQNGDYYFEFNYNSATTMFDNSACTWATIAFNYFDISVAEGTETIDGRLWSRQWSLSTSNRAPNAGTLSENSSRFHVYTSDSIITKVELEKVVPGYFNVIANQNGVGTTGVFADDSKSATSPAVRLNRLNQIFLNTPDTSVFPARELTRSISPIYVQRCGPDDQCIIADLNRTSSANVYLEINGIPGFQASTSDRLINTTLLTRGINCIPWDGRDGDGVPVPAGDTIFIQLLFESNVTQVPLQDIESNPNGLKISLELPISGSTAVFWDDTDVGGGSELTGCVGSATVGCHSWVGDFSTGIGNGNVINSYWYSTLDTLIPIPIVDSTFSLNIVTATQDVSCNPTSTIDPGPITLVNFAGPKTIAFRWKTTGTGTFTPHDSTLFADYIPSAEDVEFGGIVKFFLTPRIGCPEVIDSLLVDFGNRPGGVTTGLIGWYKANDGARNAGNTGALNGEIVKTWRNKAFLGNDATAVDVGPIYTENVFNNNGGLVFSDNDNQRMTFPVDFGTVVSGNGTFNAANSVGVDDELLANGSPDTFFAEIHDATDSLVMDLGQELPIGTDYTITWRRKSTYGAGPTADMLVRESSSANSGYSTNSFTPQTTNNSTFITTTLTTEVPTRYLKIATLTGTDDDIDFDAVSYSVNNRKNETVFLVAKKTNNTGNTYLGAGSSNNLRRFYGTTADNPRFRFDGTGTTVDASPIVANDEAFVSTYQVNLSGNEQVVYNGTVSYNTDFGSIGEVTSFILGNNANNAGELAGAIGEVIVYNEALTSQEIQQIESYLAVKYGITLNRDYLDSDGTLLFTADGAGGNVHDNDIAGIGLEECAVELNQQKSISENADAVVQMSNSTSLDEKDYLIWGNDNASLVTRNVADVNPAWFTERLDRVWKAQSTNNTGTVRLAFYLGNITGAPTDIRKYGLVQSSTPTMAGASYTSYAKSISNDTLYFEAVPFSGISYFTLATDVVDNDNDGIVDIEDVDDDNDGILDIDEGFGINNPAGDEDGDGILNYLDANDNGNGGDGSSTVYGDNNGDGVQDVFDADGDGIPDHFDLDADNDGIPDIVEAGGEDTDGNGLIDDINADGTLVNDLDKDGLDDRYDANSGTENVVILNADTDGDGIKNFQDLDSDNDGIPDVVEAGGTDTNGDGRADDYLDADGDGFNDIVDGDPNQDGTSDNTANALTVTGGDGNNDGVPDSYPNDDFDGDGVLNYLDLDADDDGIMDVVEAGGSDTNRDGIEDAFADADDDGFNDNVDGDTDNSLAVGDDTDGGQQANATTLTDQDADLDGVPDSYPNSNFDGDNNYNFLDIDADNDGIVDNTEGQSTAGYIAPAGMDADGDGIDDNYDDDDANFGGAGAVGYLLSDIDGATFPNTPDYIDINSDGDFFLDAIEGHDSNNDNVPDAGSIANLGVPGGSIDVDGDGLLDGYDNNTSSPDPTNGGFEGIDYPNLDNSFTTERDWREFPDSDNDGITDDIDIDKDNDGILDKDECLSTGTFPFSGGDGGSSLTFSQDGVTTAYLDIDRVDNSFEFTVNGSFINANNQLQLQANDLQAGQVFLEFTDGADMGTPWVANFNGLPRVRFFIDPNGQVSIIGTRTTGSTVLEAMQTRDGSGFNDVTFNAGSNTFIIENLDGAGADGYAGSAYLISSCDTDGDGIDDFLDLDSDNDGIPDVVEAGGTDANNDGLVDGFTDTDGDGWADILNPVRGGTPLVDGDQDGDGFPNRLDLDSDDDGIQDILEAGGVDVNNDGIGDNSADGDADGWFNIFDSDNGGTALTVPDTDGDGTLPNYLDLDSDNDGIIDNIEWQTTTDFMVPSGVDANNNGWDDEYDDGPTPQAISNNDGTGDPDYIDLDTDDDGQTDWLERADDDEDGDALLDLIAIANAYESANANPNHYVSTDDADADDIPDFLEDADADGTPNFLDPDNAAFYRDTDKDGIVDLYDVNQNGNNRENVTQLGELDNDGAPDFRDTDNQISLPIQLVSFTATKVGEYVQLKWITASEINNDYFTIERSTDGENFQEIQFEKGAGNSNQVLTYMRYDESPKKGYNYYRLKQTDFDGREERFNVEVVKFDSGSNQKSKEEYRVYPNPTSGGQLFLEMESPKAGEYRVEIRSSLGQLIQQQTFLVEEETIHFEQEVLRRTQLAKGVYYLKLQIKDEVNTFKVVVN